MSALIEAKNLSKTFIINKRFLHAVRQVNLSIHSGETFGLVGESGCGKSTLGRTLLRLYEPTNGSIYFHGENMTQFSPAKMKLARRQMQMIFQDPYASLNPRMTIEDIISEPLEVHQVGSDLTRKSRVSELLNLVNLPSNCTGRFPHEFSGGQRQRIGIARALALHPEFIVCDEPISALDVSIQAQIANLLLKLQQELNLTYLFIAHDLAMVKVLCKNMAVMYLGEIIETGPVEAIYKTPGHPYTQILLASIPLHDPVQEKKRAQVFLRGEPPSPLSILPGCSFSQRCPQAQAICFEQKPLLKEIASNHFAACHF